MTQSAAYSSSYRFESILKMPIEISGKITCKACNVLACDSVTDNILVSGKNILRIFKDTFLSNCYNLKSYL